MRPRVGCRNLVSRLKQVVLPAPFGPISAWMVPRSTRRLTPLTATKPANSMVRFCVSRMISLTQRASDRDQAITPIQAAEARAGHTTDAARQRRRGDRVRRRALRGQDFGEALACSTWR